jgi:poly(beta-D-mannuronate) C5 epimerase
MRTKQSRAAGYMVVVATVLGLASIGTFVLGRSYSELALQKEPFHRLPYVPSFDPIEDVTLGLPPNSGNFVAAKPAASIRAIEVYPTQTILYAGGKAIRSINIHAPATLRKLGSVVANRGWISAVRHTVTMHAALVIEHGSSMTIAAPSTSELIMSVRRGVFLAANQGHLHLSGVYVHASDTKVPATFSPPSRVAGRPFILAAQDSSMIINNCIFRYLGRDWNSSYGLTWSKGSTGSVRNSLFEHDFIGVYSNDSTNLKVEHDRFYYDSLYGIDPHSGSSHLVIEYDTADFNGRHGIIFSNHVTDGVVRHNVAEGNGLNGIMMDESSNHNTIEDNAVIGNKSGGVVIANSSNDVVSANTIYKNRVGITVRGHSRDVTVTGNTVTGNQVASQGAGLTRNNVYGNGGQWSERRISVIWLGALGLLILLFAVTWLSKVGRGNHILVREH